MPVVFSTDQQVLLQPKPCECEERAEACARGTAAWATSSGRLCHSNLRMGEAAQLINCFHPSPALTFSSSSRWTFLWTSDISISATPATQRNTGRLINGRAAASKSHAFINVALPLLCTLYNRIYNVHQCMAEYTVLSNVNSGTHV